MQFDEAVTTLLDLPHREFSGGIERTARLLDTLDDPHEGLCCVQIAGSNGKGSTARMLERVLRASGLDVGLYTSPHLDDLRERIAVNGQPIPKGAFVEFVDRVRGHVTDRATAGESPTFFEAMTALALWEFDRRDVDVAILEAGLGGRYDATSVVDSAASAVTSVSLEHTEYLGETVTEIARDLAQVAPRDRPLVTAANGRALRAVRDVAGPTLTVGHESGVASDGGPRVASTAVPTDAGPDVAVTYGGRTDLESAVTLRGPDWTVEATLPLLGGHQATNAGIAVTLARQVADVEPDAIRRGLRNAHWPGRFEVVCRAPLVVLDGAHNPASCERTAETLASFDYDYLHVVTGAMVDKDHEGLAAALDAADRVTVCEPDSPRAADARSLATVFDSETAAVLDVERDVANAVRYAVERADAADCVLVVGSLYVVADARQRWRCSGSTAEKNRA